MDRMIEDHDAEVVRVRESGKVVEAIAVHRGRRGALRAVEATQRVAGPRVEPERRIKLRSDILLEPNTRRAGPLADVGAMACCQHCRRVEKRPGTAPQEVAV